MKKIIIIGIGILIIGIWFFIGSGGSSDTSIKTKVNDFDRLASLSLIDYRGNVVSLEKFRGTPLVVNSWAVWCPFCRQELPDFAELQKEFDERVVVIAIDRQEPLEKAKGYTDELGITDNMLFLLDSDDSFYKSLGGFSMPETVFINREGEIVVHKRGPMDLNEMREHANKIIHTNDTSL